MEETTERMTGKTYTVADGYHWNGDARPHREVLVWGVVDGVASFDYLDTGISGAVPVSGLEEVAI